jgi:hypothetical protein
MGKVGGLGSDREVWKSEGVGWRGVKMVWRREGRLGRGLGRRGGGAGVGRRRVWGKHILFVFSPGQSYI